MRPDLVVARRARADIHVAAFAGDGYPLALEMHQAGNAEARARSEHDAAGVGLGRTAADLLEMAVAERHDGQCLRLEIVENDDVAQPHRRQHAFGSHHPRAVGERYRIAVDRPGHSQDGRARLDRQALDHGGTNGLVDRREVRRLDDLRFAGLGFGVHDDAEARIGAADVADQDRKFKAVRFRLSHGVSAFPSRLAVVQPVSLALSMISPVARLSAIGMS